MTMSNVCENSVVMCFDKNYGPMACVALTSVFINSKDADFVVDLIQVEDDQWLNLALNKMAHLYKRDIRQHYVDKSLLNEFHVSNHITKTAYLRLFIPDYVVAKKALYLDCDLIVQCNVRDIFSIGLEENQLIAGVEDLTGQEYAKARLGISDQYINSGVLLVDVEEWRRMDVSRRFVEYYSNNVEKITWHDQCVINGALEGRKKTIDAKFNTLINDMKTQFVASKTFCADNFYGIFHYNSTTKPWHLTCEPEYKALWDMYAAVSPIKPQESSGFMPLSMDIQQLRKKFMGREITPLDWLGDSPTRFDDYTRYAKDCKKILELGVYTGLSTAAWLMAKPDSIISIDITDEYFYLRPCIEKIARDLGVAYEFIKMNDLDYKPDAHDFLFIDTTHTFEQTIQELNVFGQFTSKRIVLHDVASHLGVYHAVLKWLWENKNFRIVEHDNRGDGVIVLERYFGV